jgi:hypothetical protein
MPAFRVRMGPGTDCSATAQRDVCSPPTKTFIALRMAVNDEPGELRRLLETGSVSPFITNGNLACETVWRNTASATNMGRGLGMETKCCGPVGPEAETP